MMAKTFVCGSCKFSITYDYLGTSPSFCKSVCLLEKAYIKKDPFTEQKRCIVLGSHCALCRNAVCISSSCSLFYTKRFCLECVMKHFAEFPEEIQLEMQRKDIKDKG